jgi:hypothetical protein
MLKKALIIAFPLTAATWILVYVTQRKVPLDKTDTTVVFAIWYGVALLGLWGWKRFHKGRQHAAKEK